MYVLPVVTYNPPLLSITTAPLTCLSPLFGFGTSVVIPLEKFATCEYRV